MTNTQTMDAIATQSFSDVLKAHHCSPLTRDKLSELQINLGYLCNQACEHCHVEAGPKRTEMMNWQTMERILKWAVENDIKTVDLTGGAPEMNPNFRKFCACFLEKGINVTARCNITVQYEPNQENLVEWYAANKIRLVCSLPCYSKENVDQQRGKGVFNKSIKGLQAFNQIGYARQNDLRLDLVYNPVGPNLPPSQQPLEAEYKSKLKQDFDIDFNNLLTITNLPIKRFAHFLKRTGQLESYQTLLVKNFNPETVSPLMCRHLISVDWQGFVYDCDFNQMLDLPLAASGKTRLWDIQNRDLQNAPIATAKHCFGCTAGAGSSCGGALI